MHIKTSTLPEGTVIELTTATGVGHRYEKKYGWWFDGIEHLTAEELDDFDEIGLDIKVISFPEPVVIDENTSDGYHTFKELYEMRLLLSAGVWGYLSLTTAKVCRSKKHSDGSVPFGGGWFIVVAELPDDIGQISFHYELKDWELFDGIPEVDLPPAYDGHTSADVVDRLRAWIPR